MSESSDELNRKYITLALDLLKEIAISVGSGYSEYCEVSYGEWTEGSWCGSGHYEGVIINHKGIIDVSNEYNPDGIQKLKNRSIISVLNELAPYGWRVISSYGSNGYILERRRNSQPTRDISNSQEKEEDLCLGNFIEAEEEIIEDEVSKNLLREDLENVLDTLSPRERDVLRLRYGLDDGRMKTVEEIGTIFNVTRERIRQIEAKALRKLSHTN